MPKIRKLLGGKLTRQSGVRLRWEPGAVTVEFANNRRQTVAYCFDEPFYAFSSRIVRADVVEQVGRERVAQELLLRNRHIDVVAFRFDAQGGVEAFVEQRAARLQGDELRFYLLQLAREADRLEFLLTGRDYH
jgi:hypothetical protein